LQSFTFFGELTKKNKRDSKEVDRELERRRAERQAEQAEANAWKRHYEMRDELRRFRDGPGTNY
jgi:hypothetical protein